MAGAVGDESAEHDAAFGGGEDVEGSGDGGDGGEVDDGACAEDRGEGVGVGGPSDGLAGELLVEPFGSAGASDVFGAGVEVEVVGRLVGVLGESEERRFVEVRDGIDGEPSDGADVSDSVSVALLPNGFERDGREEFLSVHVLKRDLEVSGDGGSYAIRQACAFYAFGFVAR